MPDSTASRESLGDFLFKWLSKGADGDLLSRQAAAALRLRPDD